VNYAFKSNKQTKSEAGLSFALLCAKTINVHLNPPNQWFSGLKFIYTTFYLNIMVPTVFEMHILHMQNANGYKEGF